MINEKDLKFGKRHLNVKRMINLKKQKKKISILENMQIDAVQRPSWQAMVRGKKTWFLKPPAECENVCAKHLNATMEPSDICEW